VRANIHTAEMVKYVNNAFHALKVVFANEVGSICKAHGIDGQEVMEIFCQDRRLNISPAYLKPGFAFGGSCLPKDLRALLYRAKERDLECDMLSGVLYSNQRQIQRGVELVERTGRKKVGILGLSFKGGTDDVRESPTVALAGTPRTGSWEERMKALAGSRVLMLLENSYYIEDPRVTGEARALAAGGYKVSVICPRHGRQPWHEVLDGVHVYRFPEPPPGKGL